MDVDLSGLNSQDPCLRAETFRLLRHEYDPFVGESLVAAFIRETSPGVWWIASICVMPIWLPVLDRQLRKLPAWPFSGAQTIQVLQLANGRMLHSGTKIPTNWLDHPGWEYRFAAFRWLQVGDSSGAALEAARHLLDKIDAEFRVSEEDRSDFWMDDFNNLEKRKLELLEYVAEAGE